MSDYTCFLCESEETGFGNNPQPFFSYENRVCDACNYRIIIQARRFYAEGCRMPENDPKKLLKQYKNAILYEIVPQEKAKAKAIKEAIKEAEEGE